MLFLLLSHDFQHCPDWVSPCWSVLSLGTSTLRKPVLQQMALWYLFSTEQRTHTQMPLICCQHSFMVRTPSRNNTGRLPESI